MTPDPNHNKVDNVEMIYNTALISDPKEPKNIMEALTGPKACEWRESAKEEFENFLKQNSREFVD